MIADTCPECGREVSSSGAAHCSYCDAPLNTVSAEIPETDGDGADHAAMSFPDRGSQLYDRPQTASTIVLAPQSTAAIRQGVATAPDSPYSARNLSVLADRMREAAIRTTLICGITLAVVAIYLSRPESPAPPLPTGIATMATPGNQTSGAQQTAAGEVGSYLAFLQKIDLQRTGLLTSFNQALASANMPSVTAPPAQSSTSPTNIGAEAQTLLQDFLTQKPPTDCSDLASLYYRLLQDQTGMVSKACTALAAGDVRTATATHDAADPTIQQDAAGADNALANLSGAQHIDKPFNIQAEPATTPTGSAPDNATPFPVAQPAQPQPAGNTSQPVNPPLNSTVPNSSQSDSSTTLQTTPNSQSYPSQPITQPTTH